MTAYPPSARGVTAMSPDEARAIRTSMGWNQAQMAAALDVRRQTISEWEQGRRPITKTNELALKYLACQHAAKETTE